MSKFICAIKIKKQSLTMLNEPHLFHKNIIIFQHTDALFTVWHRFRNVVAEQIRLLHP